MRKKQALTTLPSLFDEPFFPRFIRGFGGYDEDFIPSTSEQKASNLSVWEDENNLYVEAALPGAKPNDIEVTLDKGNLWVKGESKRHEEDKNRKYYYKAASSFSYRVTLPGEVNESKEPIADYADGILKITFVKQQEEKPKKISVKSSS